MRTKLLGLAALAACAFSASAQSNVYSLNVVGYYNVTLPANQLVMVANQLNTTNNTIASLIPTAAPGTQVYKYAGGYTIATMDEFDLVWDHPEITLNPGEGAFIRSPSATTLTFVGEVLQGSLTNTLPLNGLSIRSSIVPQAGTATALGIPGEPGDQLYQYKPAGYAIATFDEFDLAWDTMPNLAVGESFFYRKSPTSTQSRWVRDFTVQ